MTALVAFIGGAGDSRSRIVRRLCDSACLPTADKRYFSWCQRRAVRLLMQQSVEPVVLIGHSWGAVTALCLARQMPQRVTLLLTLDPVGWYRPQITPGSRVAEHWINVWVPARKHLTNRNNLIACLGRHWGALAEADENHCVAGDHGSATAMLQPGLKPLLQLLAR